MLTFGIACLETFYGLNPEYMYIITSVIDFTSLVLLDRYLERKAKK